MNNKKANFIFISLACISLLSPLMANARYQTVITSGLYPLGRTGYKVYIKKQIQYMNHLRTCQPFKMRVSNPLQPDVIIKKTIIGRAGRYCRTRKSLVVATRRDIPAYVNFCYYNHVQIDHMTSPIEYEYIKDLAQIHHYEHDLSLDSPEMVKIEKRACRKITEKTVSPVAKAFYGK